MALSKDDLEALDEAIASAELTVTINNRTITYRSIADLLSARRHVASVIAKQTGKAQNPLGSFVVTKLDRGIR